MRIYSLKGLTSNFGIIDGQITITEVRKEGTVFSIIEFEYDGKKIISEDIHIYNAFVDLRTVLHSKDIFLLCKGCLINVYPSGRMLSSGKAYDLKLGKRTGFEDTVEIFSPIEIKDLFSIENQRDFYNAWLESIKGLPY